jgi:hypothetical protein
MLLRCGLRSLAMAEMGTGGQEIKAGLFCCNSELDELRNRKLLVSKHESHHVVFESGSGFVRALIGYSSLSPPPEERVRPVRIGRAAFPNTGYYFFAMDCAAEFLIAGTPPLATPVVVASRKINPRRRFHLRRPRATVRR